MAFLGDPSIALTGGVLISLALAPRLNREVLSKWTWVPGSMVISHANDS
jgi:hypothetical protein